MVACRANAPTSYLVMLHLVTSLMSGVIALAIAIPTQSSSEQKNSSKCCSTTLANITKWVRTNIGQEQMRRKSYIYTFAKFNLTSGVHYSLGHLG